MRDARIRLTHCLQLEVRLSRNDALKATKKFTTPVLENLFLPNTNDFASQKVQLPVYDKKSLVLVLGCWFASVG